MPRSSVLLTRVPVSGDHVAAAAGDVWARVGAALQPEVDGFDLRVLDDGAALQVLAADEIVLSVLRPRLLPTLDEVARLLPTHGADLEDVGWWSDAYSPWQPRGRLGVLILDALASASGFVVHQDLGSSPRPSTDGQP